MALLAVACTFGAARADEGMWMLSHISPASMKIMKDLGLQMSEQELYDPDGVSLKDAVVSFGGFCSGVIVSPDGLVFTNHHCGFGSIQNLATPENDILRNGFVARELTDELPAKGLHVSILQRTEDVTDRVQKALKQVYKKNAREIKKYGPAGQETWRLKSLDSICTAVEKDYSEQYPGLNCEVTAYYTGNAFYINIYKVYNDIRLVFAPPQSLGKFGGETDNWMWPRQTCDFSVFRIYADSDNQPAEYSPQNRPLQASRYARISLDGFRKGDYCMTIGYPGSTDRYLSSFGIVEQMENENSARINVRGVKQVVWKKWMDSDPAIRLQYASKYAQSSNYWKNNIGMNKALKELGVVEQKQEKEKAIGRWLLQKRDTRQRFGSMLASLEQAYAARKDINRALCYMNESFLGGPDILRVARFYQFWQSSTSESSAAKWKNNLQNLYKDWNLQVDREAMTALIDNYAHQVDARYQPDFYQTIRDEFGGNTQAYVDSMFAHTILTDSSCLSATPSPEVLDTDPALVCMNTIKKMYSELSQQIQTENKLVSENERLLCQAILEMDMDTPHYSDANLTMRLSYGFVNDYTSAAGHYDYYTTASSILDKIAVSNSIDDYRVEPEVKQLFEQQDYSIYKDKDSNELQLCFLTNNDITGGNSGSPMFNGKGELIGLAFDGNWDAMSSDVSFTQDLTRCIGVDIRFVLYIIDRWGGADRLIREMGVR